ncbi:TRAP transporter substrate-binding protein [Clostridium sp. DL1XJH146]
MRKKLLYFIIFAVSSIAIVIFISLFFNRGKDISSKLEIIKDNNIEDEQELVDYNKDLIVLKVAHYLPESHPQHTALMNKFVPIIEEESNWKIKVELYPNNKLGKESEYIEGVKKGTIEIGIGSQSLLDEINELNIIKFPYVFENYNEAEQILNNKVSPVIEKELLDIGIRNLGWGLNGFNQISTLRKFRLNSDGQELKIATQQDQLNIEILQSIGFEPYISNISETKMLLRQKIIDGYEYPLLLNYYNQWYKYQRYLYVTNHTLSADMYMINEEFFQSLSEENKNLIIYALKETAEYEVELLENLEENIYKTLEKEGVNIEYPKLDEYKEKIQPLYNQLLGNDDSLKALFQDIRSYN